MELWFIYILLSIVFTGLHAFTGKVAAARGYNASYNTGITAIVVGLMGLLVALWYGDYPTSWGIVIFLSAVNGGFYAISAITRIESLRLIDTTIFLPLYKTVGPVIALVIGILFFKENISLLEGLGIAVSLLVPLTLIHKSEHTIQKALLPGLALAMASTVTIVISHVANKQMADIHTGLFMFIALSMLITAILSFILYYKNNGWKIKSAKPEGTESIALALVSGVLQFAAFYTLLLAFTYGDLGVVYAAHSLYLVIPIMLSVWWYNEHFNLRKAVAIALSILALFFFV